MFLIVQSVKPAPSLSLFVDSFWMLHNASDDDKKVIVLPDGKIDLFFSLSATEPFHVTLMGLGTQPDEATITAHMVIFAISFKLPATEYILHQQVAHLTDNVALLPLDFWGFCVDDLNDFDSFCKKAAQKL